MSNNYICLNCQTEQPTNPFNWCHNCYGVLVLKRLTKRSGYITVNLYAHDGLGKPVYSIGFSNNKPEKTYMLFHSFYCDCTKTAIELLRVHLYIYDFDGVNSFELQREQSEYIKTITEFKDGKFHFKGENNNG